MRLVPSIKFCDTKPEYIDDNGYCECWSDTNGKKCAFFEYCFTWDHTKWCDDPNKTSK